MSNNEQLQKFFESLHQLLDFESDPTHEIEMLRKDQEDSSPAFCGHDTLIALARCRASRSNMLICHIARLGAKYDIDVGPFKEKLHA